MYNEDETKLVFPWTIKGIPLIVYGLSEFLVELLNAKD